MTQEQTGAQSAEIERLIDFAAREWWRLHMKSSDALAVKLKGNGRVEVFWRDDDESGSYTLPVDFLAALRTPPDAAAGEGLREAETLLRLLVDYDQEAAPNGIMDAIDNDRSPYQSSSMAGLITHARGWLHENARAALKGSTDA